MPPHCWYSCCGGAAAASVCIACTLDIGHTCRRLVQQAHADVCSVSSIPNNPCGSTQHQETAHVARRVHLSCHGSGCWRHSWPGAGRYRLHQPPLSLNSFSLTVVPIALVGRAASANSPAQRCTTVTVHGGSKSVIGARGSVRLPAACLLALLRSVTVPCCGPCRQLVRQYSTAGISNGCQSSHPATAACRWFTAAMLHDSDGIPQS